MTSELDSKIRILCVDDHPLMLDGVSRAIGLQADMEVIGTASTGEEGWALFQQRRPDIIVTDLRLPRMRGLELIQAIRRESNAVRIVVLTIYDGDEEIHRALQAGADAYVLKSSLSSDLIRTLREVYAGGHPLTADVASQLAARALSSPLSRREVMVIELMARGLRNKEIAAQLSIGEDTVEAHAKSIFSKLKVNDRTAAVTIALRRGIIHMWDSSDEQQSSQ